MKKSLKKLKDWGMIATAILLISGAAILLLSSYTITPFLNEIIWGIK